MWLRRYNGKLFERKEEKQLDKGGGALVRPKGDK